MSVEPMRLCLLQAPRLVLAGDADHVLPRKDAVILAMLALDGPTSRAGVAALTWSNADDRRARNNLRQRLFRLHRVAGQPVVQMGSTLALAPQVTHDLASFTGLLRTDPDAAQGPLLGSFEYDDSEPLAQWVRMARERWRSRLREALVEIAIEFEDQNRIAEALRYATRLVLQEPLHEHGSRLLMRLHSRRGDRGAALAEFERCVSSLHEQLGERPSDETIELAQRIGMAEAPAARIARPMPAALRHPPRTVGRDAVLDAAERRWNETGAVLLCGPAGIGKSRVLDELAARWRIALVLRAAPDDAGQGHGLLARLVTALLDGVDLAEGGADAYWLRWLSAPHHELRPPFATSPTRLAELLGCALSLGQARGIDAIAVEDLHAADAASLDVLCRVLPIAARGPAGTPASVRWLLSSRDEPLPLTLEAWVEAGAGGLDPVVRLAPLDLAQTAELLVDLLGPEGDSTAWGVRLHRHCGGHPLFVLQVLRELFRAHHRLPPLPPAEMPVPAELLSLVTRRIGRASAATQQLAYVAALCGIDFNAALAARLMQCHASQLLVPWHTLEALDILHGEHFSHDLVRQAVLDAVPQALAPLIHRDIAHALRDAGASPARRARHWEAAAAWPEAALDLADAADLALDAGLQSAACALLLRAAQAYRLADGVAEAFRCEWRAGRLLLATSSVPEALAIAHRLAAAATDASQRARALELLSQARAEQHDPSALADAQAAHAWALGSGDEALVLLTRLRVAAALSLVGRPDDALAELERLAPDARLLDKPERKELIDLHSVALAHAGRLGEAVRVNQGALDEASDSGDPAQVATCAGNIAIQLSYLGRVDEAIRWYERAVDSAHRAGVERGYILVDEMGLAGNHADLGRFTTALRLYERILPQLAEGGYTGWAVNAQNECAATYMRLGRFDLAQRLLGALPPDAPAWVRAARRLALARLTQFRAEPRLAEVQDAVLALVQEAVHLLEPCGALGNPYVKQRIDLELARWTSAESALTQAERVGAWADRHEQVSLRRYAGMVRTEALSNLGLASRAATAADELAAQFSSGWQAFGFYLPELWLVLCKALTLSGAPERAAATARMAANWIDARAVEDVPDLYRASFLHVNPFNRQLLNWTSR